MGNKRGVSEVITNILLILLSVVAVAILWAFLQPIFTKSGAKLEQAEACLSANFEIMQCTAYSDSANVSVKRNAGMANIREIKLIFEKFDGSTSAIVQNNTPAELETRVYSVNLGFDAERVSVAAGIADKDEKISYCNPSQPVDC